MRDQQSKEGWENKDDAGKESVAKRCVYLFDDLFPKLRGEVEAFPNLSISKEWNYRPDAADNPEKFFNNLWHTEIDIVLETPNHIFIGEAKHESRLNASSDYVLVHQLLRQYVMATILTNYVGESKIIVPFVVGNAPQNLKSRHAQVKFMLAQGWLETKNILSWDDIAAIKG